MRFLLTDIFDSHFNPVMVRDVYRGLQNNIIMLLLVAFTVCNMLLVCSVVFLPDRFMTYLFSQDIWPLLMWLAYAVCAFALPVWFMISAARDKLCKANLLKMTFISPFMVIRGQALSSMIIVMLFTTFILPFGLFCFFRGGLDLVCMGGEIMEMLVIVWLNLLFSLTLVSLGRNWTVTLIFMAAAAAGMGLLSFGGARYGGGIFEHVIRPATWDQLAIAAIVIVGTSGMLYILAATVLNVPDANRALPIRLYATGVIATWGGMAWYVAKYKFDVGPLLTWMEASFWVLAALCAFTACERSQSTPRIQRMIPHFRVLRIPCYFLYSGASNGLCWCAAIGAAIGALWHNFYHSLPDWAQYLHVWGTEVELFYACYVACFAFALSITVILIRYVIFHDWYPRLWNLQPP